MLLPLYAPEPEGKDLKNSNVQEVSSQLQSPFKALSNLQPTSKLAGQQLSTSALQNSPAATPGRSVPPQGHAEEEFSRWGQQKHQLSRESHNGASASGRLGKETNLAPKYC